MTGTLGTTVCIVDKALAEEQGPLIDRWVLEAFTRHEGWTDGHRISSIDSEFDIESCPNAPEPHIHRHYVAEVPE